jgi:hypothetical protein
LVWWTQNHLTTLVAAATDRELVSAVPLAVDSEFQSRFGARTMLKLEAVIRLCSEFFDTKFKNLSGERKKAKIKLIVFTVGATF